MLGVRPIRLRRPGLDKLGPSATMDGMSSDPTANDDQGPDRTEVVAYLRSHRARFQREYHVRRIAVIGSFARGEQRPDSDLDILVDLEPGTDGIHRLKRQLRDELERKFGRKVEVASERYLKPYYRDAILREAVYV